MENWFPVFNTERTRAGAAVPLCPRQKHRERLRRPACPAGTRRCHAGTRRQNSMI